MYKSTATRPDDEKKLARVLKYLQQSKCLTLILDADDPIKTQWWVDAAYAVHPTMKRHTGGILS